MEHKKRALIRSLTVISSAALVAGCTGASLQTKALPADAQFVDTTEAIAYALPKGQLKLNIKWDGKADFPTVKLLGTEFSPDPDARYILQTRHSLFANDKFVLTTRDGLLTSINVENEDKTLGAVAQAAEVAKTIIGGLSVPSGRGRGELEPFDRTILFDPFDVGALSTKLKDVHLFAYAEEVSGNPLASGTGGDNCTHQNSSLCYRVPLTVQVTISGLNEPGRVFNGYSHTVQGQVADLGTTYGYNVQRAACTKKVTALTFTEGMLTKVDVNEPSEILGCLQAVPDLIQNILPLPWGG